MVRFSRPPSPYELESEGGMRISKQNYIFVPFVSFYFLDFFRISSKNIFARSALLFVNALIWISIIVFFFGSQKKSYFAEARKFSYFCLPPKIRRFAPIFPIFSALRADFPYFFGASRRFPLFFGASRRFPIFSRFPLYFLFFLRDSATKKKTISPDINHGD